MKRSDKWIESLGVTLIDREAALEVKEYIIHLEKELLDRNTQIMQLEGELMQSAQENADNVIELSEQIYKLEHRPPLYETPPWWAFSWFLLAPIAVL